MTTNEQREAAAILQMRKDLDEARELLLSSSEACDALVNAAHYYGISDQRLSEMRRKMYEFLVRTEPKQVKDEA
ncbi:MAG: hypothetical protein ACRDAM_03465 [Casimicrobium sp.]